MCNLTTRETLLLLLLAATTSAAGGSDGGVFNDNFAQLSEEDSGLRNDGDGATMRSTQPDQAPGVRPAATATCSHK